MIHKLGTLFAADLTICKQNHYWHLIEQDHGNMSLDTKWLKYKIHKHGWIVSTSKFLWHNSLKAQSNRSLPWSMQKNLWNHSPNNVPEDLREMKQMSLILCNLKQGVDLSVVLCVFDRITSFGSTRLRPSSKMFWLKHYTSCRILYSVPYS